ncbi:uncharacterized protein MONOS_12795 [Monocercomonoides exilis]|uniref:uncharacterized protein n=1 Tax=Monocercomonoides exilis TaxID=2049356 RepID=UPI0035596209|nr:hypothetical protein MONOS_12795 [Monocercomonoides exilis]|eukprot:MONOS_12795.1-p1 / transcript=MONOS_12795.1 / gene=MONOS_12795 / organism=Monocercomonoides_exilis_PA203 / gene_product=unspecified product / transcript_product=unspecified product / location=Mono_scaffold00734:5673-6095(-) / protein_length=119 / sequence_SO=supercontig / SO=protein_coding / is_pseudo=false
MPDAAEELLLSLRLCQILSLNHLLLKGGEEEEDDDKGVISVIEEEGVGGGEEEEEEEDYELDCSCEISRASRTVAEFSGIAPDGGEKKKKKIPVHDSEVGENESKEKGGKLRMENFLM